MRGSSSNPTVGSCRGVLLRFMRPAGHALGVTIVWALGSANAAGQTALDTYVTEFDATYSWTLQNTIPGAGYRTHIVNMTSQTWRDPNEVNHTEWQHWLTVVIPDGSPLDTAMLYITGGHIGGSAPGQDWQLANAALATNSVMAKLSTVPNQPLRFSDESISRSEDEIIAYTFDKWLGGGDQEWPLLLPMVKSAVRAMDTVQQLVPEQTGDAVMIDDFTVYGVSKRGWTTWLTGAVDPRVQAIAPTVIDVLNIDEQMAHHRAFYEGVTDHIVGGYSWVLEDYVAFDIPDNLDTPAAQALLDVVDPYEYRDRYADIPKMVINATGDEFFVPNSSPLYFDGLPGEKYLRYVPNAGHTGFFDTAVLFHQAVASGVDLPDFTWTVEDGGRTIRVTTDQVPHEVKMWQAHNPVARDFRHSISTPPPVWQASTLSDLGGGQYIAEVPFPDSGATAFMVELAFDSGGVNPYIFTTGVSVVDPIPEPLLGDVNLDDSVDEEDIDPFMDVLLAGPFDVAADMNEDGVLDGRDITQFVAALQASSGVQAIPEPATVWLAGIIGLLCVLWWRRVAG